MIVRLLRHLTTEQLRWLDDTVSHWPHSEESDEWARPNVFRNLVEERDEADENNRPEWCDE